MTQLAPVYASDPQDPGHVPARGPHDRTYW